MANQDAEMIVDKLQEIADIVDVNSKQSTRETRLATLTKNIRPFNGESTKRCKEWLKDMTRSGLQVENAPDAMKSLALATLTGPAADFFY